MEANSMIKRIDFTSCRRLLGKAYNGANGKNIAVEYEGRQYMLKFPPSGAEKPTDLSYTNSCISEHLGSSIFNMLGIPAQHTLLGVFMEQIEQFIDETPYISDLQKDFYKAYINARYEKIMLPAFEQVTGESLTEYNSSQGFSQSF